MSVQLIGGQLKPEPIPVFGSQASLAWEFIDPDIVISAATKARVEITFDSPVSGTVTINGVVFTVGGTAAYTATTFQSGATVQITANNFLSAVRANQFTANLFNIQQQIVGSAVFIRLTAKEVGTILKTTETSLSTGFFSFVQGEQPDLKERTFYVYQGFAVDVDGNEIALVPEQRLPPGYNYATGELQSVFVSLHEAMQAHVRLTFPSIFDAATTALDYRPVKMAYLRYGTITFDGCVISAQDIKVTAPSLAIGQAAAYPSKDGSAYFNHGGTGAGDTPLMSKTAEIELPMFRDQYGWVSAFWNANIFNQAAIPAYNYAFYNAAGSAFAFSPMFSAAKSVNTEFRGSVLTVPAAPGNLPVTIPAGTASIGVRIGHTINGVFTRTHKEYRFAIIDLSCNVAEVYWKSSYGGWESLSFQEMVTNQSTQAANTYLRDNETRVFKGKSTKNYADWVGWLDDYGDQEIRTRARTVVTLRNKILDHTAESQEYWKDFLNSPDKRLMLQKGIDGTKRWVAAVRCTTKTTDFTLKTESGRVRYNVELEISSDNPFIQ